MITTFPPAVNPINNLIAAPGPQKPACPSSVLGAIASYGSFLAHAFASSDLSEVEDFEPLAVTECFEQPRYNPNTITHSALVGKYFVATAAVWDYSDKIKPGSCGRIVEQSGSIEFVIENLRVSGSPQYNVPASFFDLVQCKFFDSCEEMWAYVETCNPIVPLNDYKRTSLRMQRIN
jgi:hypothetical protein